MLHYFKMALQKVFPSMQGVAGGLERKECIQTSTWHSQRFWLSMTPVLPFFYNYYPKRNIFIQLASPVIKQARIFVLICKLGASLGFGHSQL